MRRALLTAAVACIATCAIAQQHANYVDPCKGPQVASSAVISLSGTVATALVAKSGTTTVYVCGMFFSLAGTSPTATISSASTCGTSPTNLTGAIAPTVGTFVSIGHGNSAITKTASGANLCLTLAGTSPVAAGVVTYVQQ